MKHKVQMLVMLLIVSALILTACGPTATATPAADAPSTDTNNSSDNADVFLVVGSKDFTEQIILGELTILALRNAGYTVEDETNLGGSSVVREALVDRKSVV